MKVLISEKLSQNRYMTDEGYLICVDSVLARTGPQTYLRRELFGDSTDNPDEEISVNRKPNEVFSDATLASFENKPLTVEHPDEDVNSSNYKQHSVGFVRDIKKGTFEGNDVMFGTLVITDKETVTEIQNGEHTNLSCGYECDILDTANPEQTNIRGNHVALCENPRAGITRIIDTEVKGMKDAEIESGHMFTKQEALTKINEITQSKQFTHEDSEGVKYLTPYAYELIKSIAKKAKLTQSDLATLNRNLFGSYGYKIDDNGDMIEEMQTDADKYTYKLVKKQNDYDEYVVRAYKNGSYNEAATYYTDDWEDAVGTLNKIAEKQGLTVKKSGNGFIADSKIGDGSKDEISSLLKQWHTIAKNVKQIIQTAKISDNDKNRLLDILELEDGKVYTYANDYDNYRAAGLMIVENSFDGIKIKIAKAARDVSRELYNKIWDEGQKASNIGEKIMNLLKKNISNGYVKLSDSEYKKFEVEYVKNNVTHIESIYAKTLIDAIKLVKCQKK